MNTSDIKLLYDYNYWTNQLLLAKAAELSAEKLTQKNAFPWGSLQATLAHILDTEKSWRLLLQYLQLDFDAAEIMELPTLEALVDYWKSEEQEMRAYLNSLQDSDMENIVRYDIPEGKRERVLWHCLVHVVNHGTQHRSECAQMLTDFGYSPGDIDFTYYMNIRAGIE